MKETKVSKILLIRSWFVSALLALAGCVCLPALIPFGGSSLLFTNSIFSLLFFMFLLAGLHKLLNNGLSVGRREWLIAGILSFLFILCMAFGASLEEKESVTFTEAGMWLAILVWGTIVTIGLAGSWQVIGRRSAAWGACRECGQGKEIVYKEKAVMTKLVRGSVFQRWERLSDGRQMTGMALFLFLCWMPVFLAVYPGFFVYDAQDEWLQVATREFTTHHPLIHVLLLGGIIQLLHKLSGSYNLGIACYTLLQMGVLATIFSMAMISMRRNGTALRIRLISLVYLGFFPVVVMFSLCSAKDGLFTGFLLLLFLMVKEIGLRPGLFFRSRGKQILYVTGAAGVMLFRHNGTYAFWLFALILLFVCRGFRKRILWLTALSMMIYLAGSSLPALVLDAKQGGAQEMLTVPIQQMTRVYIHEQNAVDPADLEVLYQFLPEEALNHYVPKVSDGVKRFFDNEAYAAEPLQFWGLWAKWAVRYPFTFLNAWFMTSYGFWYPDAVIDVYRGNTVFTYTYEDSSYFGYEVEEPGMRDSQFPVLSEWYRKLSLELTQQKLPVVSMLFSPGFLFWVMMYAVGYLWSQKQYVRLLPWLLPLLVWLTVLPGPTFLPRYVVFLWVLLPELLSVFAFFFSDAPSDNIPRSGLDLIINP